MREASRVEVTSPCTHSNFAKIDIGFHCGETDVTQPNPSETTGNTDVARDAPLFLDHLQKVAMVNYALKDRAKSKSVVSTESR